jgi:hypothetical protein
MCVCVFLPWDIPPTHAKKKKFYLLDLFMSFIFPLLVSSGIP